VWNYHYSEYYEDKAAGFEYYMLEMQPLEEEEKEEEADKDHMKATLAAVLLFYWLWASNHSYEWNQ
jgi:hypothetical protein